MTNEPFGILSTRDVQWRHATVTDPVDVGTAGEEKLRHSPLAAVAGAPESARDRIGGWRFAASEVRFQAVHQPKRGGIGECGAGAPLDEPTGGIPLPESTRIREWRTTADYAAGRFDVRAGLDQRIEHRDIVAARRPMQWRLGV